MGDDLLDLARTFQRLHRGDDPFVMANPWDIGSARLFARLGYEALATTGGGRAFALGVPDGSTTEHQLFDYMSEITTATTLPVTGDLEDGFGSSPDDVADTIRRAAACGLVGGSIEDRSYGTGRRRAGTDLLDIGLATDRITAAVEQARQLGHPFVVTARCEAFLVDQPDLGLTIRRLRAFEEAGADCLYAPGLRSLDEIRLVVDSVGAPVNVLLGRSGESLTVGDLAEVGVQRISVGSGIARAALGAAMAAAHEVLADGRCTNLDDALPHADACELYRPWSMEHADDQE